MTIANKQRDTWALDFLNLDLKRRSDAKKRKLEAFDVIRNQILQDHMSDKRKKSKGKIDPLEFIQEMVTAMCGLTISSQNSFIYVLKHLKDKKRRFVNEGGP